MKAHTWSFALILAGLLLAGGAQARLYQWVNPDSGYTQLSGKPPSWYRSAQPGPRVFVFENGQLLDDTDVAVNAAQRQELRWLAFSLANEEQQALSEERAQRLAELYGKAEEEEFYSADEEGEEPTFSLAAPDLEGEAAAEEDEETATINRLRNVVTAWDLLRTEEARSILNAALPDE